MNIVDINNNVVEGFKWNLYVVDREKIKKKKTDDTWCIVDKCCINGELYYLLEHNTYGCEVPCIGINVNKGTVFKDIRNGVDELRERILSKNNFSKGNAFYV